MNIGQKIRDYRKKAGLTQKQLAEKIGRKEITIRKYESGEREPRISIIESICEALNIPIDEFGEELFEIKKKNEERRNALSQQPFDLFNEYQTNPLKRIETQYKLIDDLLLIYGYKIEYYGAAGSTEEQAEAVSKAMQNNIAPSGKVINLKTREEFEIMDCDLTDLFNGFEDYFAFKMFKFKNKSDKY